MRKQFLVLPFIFLLPAVSKAQQSIEDSLNKIIAANKEDIATSRAYNALAYEYTRKDLVKARTYLTASITIAKKINYSRGLSNAYSQLIYVLYDGGKPDSAEYYLGLVKDLVSAVPESEKEALNSNYNIMAAMYYKKAGSYLKAIPFFENAIAFYRKSGDKESTAGQLLNLGNTYTAMGNYQKATEQHLQSLKLFEEVKSDRGISFCYQSLSNSFSKLKQYNQALVYANKSLVIKTALNDRRGIGTAQSGLGDIYFGLKDYDKALNHFTESLSYAREQKNITDEQDSYLKMAKVYVAKNDVKQAVEYFNKSKELAIKLKDKATVASIDGELIALQNSARETALSENKLITTVNLFKEKGDLTREASGYKNMIDFYVGTKQFDKALEYTNKYHESMDSLQNNDLQLQIKKMEEQYRVEKKEQEIGLLKKDKELQQQKLQRRGILMTGSAVLAILVILGTWLFMNRNKLRQQMKELELRNRIAADLHDEVGSSLSSIHMLSQMASQGNGNANMDILQRMSNNAKETMDKMGDIVWMIKPGETEAASLKQRMERFAYEICSSKNISAKINVDDLERVKLTMQQRKNIYLIFKEAMNNAVKYSGTRQIDVTALQQNNTLQLKVKDIGAGFNAGLIKKGNGLDNMQNRAKELGAEMKIESDLGNGTEIILNLHV